MSTQTLALPGQLRVQCQSLSESEIVGLSSTPMTPKATNGDTDHMGNLCLNTLENSNLKDKNVGSASGSAWPLFGWPSCWTACWPWHGPPIDPGFAPQIHLKDPTPNASKHPFQCILLKASDCQTCYDESSSWLNPPSIPLHNGCIQFRILPCIGS